MDQDAAREKLNRAQAAERLLNNPLLKDAIKAMTEDAHKKFARSRPGEEGRDEREAAHAELRVLNGLLAELNRHLRKGTWVKDGLDKNAQNRDRGSQQIHA